MRVLFLYIDGVIQLFTENRFRHTKEEVHALCRELTARFGGEFDYDAWAGREGSNPFWTVAAVQWDWNADAVRELKRVLDATGARIVLSSSWRFFGFEAMKALFRIWGLDGYYIDDTMSEYYSRTHEDEMDAKEKAERAIRKYFAKRTNTNYIERRPVEILEWLDRHTEVTGYAAVDDLDLSLLLGKHFVRTDCRIEKEDADKLIAILQRDDGPFLFPEDLRAMPELEILRRIPPE